MNGSAKCVVILLGSNSAVGTGEKACPRSEVESKPGLVANALAIPATSEHTKHQRASTG